VLIVHHLNNSRSQRVLWLLEELGLEYSVKPYQRDPVTMLAPPELRQVHPLGKSPVLADGNRTLAESGAIVEYLVEEYGNGLLIPPRGSDDRLRYRYWMHYAEGSAMPPLLMSLVFSKVREAPAPLLLRPVVRGIVEKVMTRFIRPQIKLHLDFMESELQRSPWFAGDQFTGADVQMSFPLEAAASRGGLDESRPRLMDFLRRIHARPAYQRALARGGPYELLR
jgi:glutathione S-transferase